MNESYLSPKWQLIQYIVYTDCIDYYIHSDKGRCTVYKIILRTLLLCRVIIQGLEMVFLLFHIIPVKNAFLH